MRAHGYFIAAGERPTEEELKAAEKARDERRRHLISDARFRFNKDRHSRNIPDDCFWAAERMGLQEDWMSIASNQCPACGVATPHTAVVCGRCGCVLDEKKYGELKFVTVGGNAQAQTKLPMGTR
jgi:ribosomal protein S27AE